MHIPQKEIVLSITTSSLRIFSNFSISTGREYVFEQHSYIINWPIFPLLSDKNNPLKDTD